jgi:D-alanyl-D-alanine carboxypeptidase
MQQLHAFIYTVLVILSGVVVLQAQDIARYEIYEDFQAMLDKDDVYNGFLQILSADGKLNWTFVDGAFKDGAEVSETNPFHTASIGKMFTATLIMKLAEEGKLHLDDHISAHLPTEVVGGLHIFEGEDYSEEISIAQLLQHTSGLPDYIMDKPEDGSPSIFTQALQDPGKFWQVDEFLAFTREKLSAHFPPGEGYYYTDTEYVLLGLIIESKYQKELHQVFLEEFFKPLAMNSTSMFMRSKPIDTSARMAELFVGETDISTYASLSIDWAGGGLVTTTGDLLKFQQALFSGEIVSESSLRKMQNWHKESEGIYYGYGLRKFEFRELSDFLPPMTIVGHPGSSASFLFYCPELKVHMAGTFNQTNYMRETIEFLITALVTLRSYHYDTVGP